MTKISSEELAQLRSIREESTRLGSALGELTYQKMLLELDLEAAKEQLKEHSANQRAFFNQLGAKYGTGTVDYETGIITPQG